MADDSPVTFLTPEWFAALDRATRAATDVAVVGGVAAFADRAVLVRHDVTGCPPDGRTVSFVVRGTAAGTTVGPLTADDGDPTVSFHASYDAARAALSGEANAQQLLLDGRLHVRGDLDALVRHGPWFEALARAWAPVRARTR